MTSRLSYASSPDSDGEGGAETSPARSPAVSPSSADSRLPRSSSDPSLSAEDGAAPPPPPSGGAAQPPPPPYSPYKQVRAGRTGLLCRQKSCRQRRSCSGSSGGRCGVVFFYSDGRRRPQRLL